MFISILSINIPDSSVRCTLTGAVLAAAACASTARRQGVLPVVVERVVQVARLGVLAGDRLAAGREDGDGLLVVLGVGTACSVGVLVEPPLEFVTDLDGDAVGVDGRVAVTDGLADVDVELNATGSHTPHFLAATVVHAVDGGADGPDRGQLCVVDLEPELDGGDVRLVVHSRGTEAVHGAVTAVDGRTEGAARGRSRFCHGSSFLKGG